MLGLIIKLAALVGWTIIWTAIMWENLMSGDEAMATVWLLVEAVVSVFIAIIGSDMGDYHPAH